MLAEGAVVCTKSVVDFLGSPQIGARTLCPWLLFPRGSDNENLHGRRQGDPDNNTVGLFGFPSVHIIVLLTYGRNTFRVKSSAAWTTFSGLPRSRQ